MTDRNSFLSQEQRCDISYLLKDAKTQALSPFIADIFGILMREGFSLQEILESVAQCVEGFPELQEAANYLDLAAEAAGKIERQPNSTEESDEII